VCHVCGDTCALCCRPMLPAAMYTVQHPNPNAHKYCHLPCAVVYVSSCHMYHIYTVICAMCSQMSHVPLYVPSAVICAMCCTLLPAAIYMVQHPDPNAHMYCQMCHVLPYVPCAVTCAIICALCSCFPLPAAIYMVQHPNPNAHRLVVGTQDSIIRLTTLPAVGSGTQAAEYSTFMDLTDRVRYKEEQGLLSFAFHPDFDSNGRFFVSYICDSSVHPELPGQYSTVLHCTALYCTVLYCTVYSVLYCTALHYVVGLPTVFPEPFTT